jgi:plasmid stabilization system protein ParE
VPRVIITERAEQGIVRCRRFLETKNPRAALRAAQAIKQRVNILKTIPDIGKPSPEHPRRRELTIEFGDSGYVALYRHEPADDAVYVLAFRHQKEAGW